MRNMGQVVGMALAGTILAGAMMSGVGHAYLGVLHSGGPPAERAGVLAAFMVGMRRAYLVAACISLIGLWISLVRGEPKPGDRRG